MAPDDRIAEDVQLLVSQSERCRDILADIAAQPEDRGGAPFEALPLSIFLQEIVDEAELYKRETEVKLANACEGPEPQLPLRPEIRRGLGNLIQTAVQFAREQVTVVAHWDAHLVSVTVCDDGPGFRRRCYCDW